MKIYLDACCFNRPFDDQSQNRIRLESEAIVLIMERMHNKEWEWIGSDVLITELENTPDIEKRRYLIELAEWVDLHVDLTEDVIARATELEQLGLKSFDAMHVACAESIGTDIFLSTDDKLLKATLRVRDKLHVTTANPLSWLTERL